MTQTSTGSGTSGQRGCSHPVHSTITKEAATATAITTDPVNRALTNTLGWMEHQLMKNKKKRITLSFWVQGLRERAESKTDTQV